MTNLHEVFVAAQGYHRKNGYDMDEADAIRECQDMCKRHWHRSLALAIDILDLSSMEKLTLFSECILNFDHEIQKIKEHYHEGTPF